MAIWFKEYSLEEVQKQFKDNMLSHLGIELLEVGESHIKGSMPVDQRTRQPVGLLHGGASVALSESLASVAANLVVDPEKVYCVGMEINANHIRTCKEGKVIGTSEPIHLGKTTQVWETQICDQHDRLICISRITLAAARPFT